MEIKALINKLNRGDGRSIKARNNIVMSFAIKGVDMLVYFLLVPLTLGYLNEYEYGIWLTLNSILMWINSFDIGLGNGMRNRLAEALANDNMALGKVYVSTTFFMLCGLMAIMMALGACMLPVLDWYSILGASGNSVSHLNQIVFISFALFCLNFILKFIGNVYLALQMPAINNLLVCLGHLLSLIIIWILAHTTAGSLLLVALAYSASPPLIYLISYPITFSGKRKALAPSIKCFRKQYLKDLFSMGVLFFIIQLGGLLIFSTANLIISNMFGPENVTPYNIAYRYFSLVLVGMTLIISPMWSASTDAYYRGDMQWIKRTMKKIRAILVCVSLGVLLMMVISPWIYRVWLRNEIEIPVAMTVCMGIYTLILCWSLSYSNFLNGMGKLKIQAINTIAVGIGFIPLALACGKVWGLYGIVIALCVVNMSGLILNVIQFNKVLNFRAFGVWSK